MYCIHIGIKEITEDGICQNNPSTGVDHNKGVGNILQDCLELSLFFLDRLVLFLYLGLAGCNLGIQLLHLLYDGAEDLLLHLELLYFLLQLIICRHVFILHVVPSAKIRY
ncbi:hypothetical protein BMS3Bbin06_01053 [bacterium BMS3Bbin06]|nr:hypothetical protein BMS3Bbin06_01053 [bacterium BMS3Bbin06]